MAKRRRLRLRPTLRAVQIKHLPEISCPDDCSLTMDFRKHDELVFAYQSVTDGKWKVRCVQLEAGHAKADAGGWKELAQVGLEDAEWSHCDRETGDIVFTREREIIRVLPSGSKVTFEVDERITGREFELTADLTSGMFFCKNFESSQLYILGGDGRLVFGPCDFPDPDLAPDFIAADPSGDCTQWLYYIATRSGAAEVFRWDLRKQEEDSIAGACDKVGDVLREGVGSRARFQTNPGTPTMLVMQNNLFINSPSGLLKVDPETHELQLVDVVAEDGKPVNLDGRPYAIAPHDSEHIAMFCMETHRAKRCFEDCDCNDYNWERIQDVFIVRASEIDATSIEEDLKGIDWAQPLRQVLFDVGRAPTRFALDARVLMARSAHFARALGSGMRESQEGAAILLDDTTPEVMRVFMHFLHTDEFETTKGAAPSLEGTRDAALAVGRLCLAVYQFADRYGVFRLQKMALLELRDVLCPTTALPLLEEAVGDRAFDLDEEAPRACWEACVKHWRTIVEVNGEAIDSLVRRRPSLAARLLRSVSTFLPPPAILER